MDMEMGNELRRKNRTRFKKKEVANIRLPSEPIYLQRIQGAHEIQKNKNFRKKKKKSDKLVSRFMD